MEQHFYGGIAPDLTVPEPQRYWLLPGSVERVQQALSEAPIDLAMGGWGQDGHIAYNQARRHPYSRVNLEDVYGSTIRIQENNLDTILALAHRSFGGAYQFVPPMSITLGVRECLAARRVRVYSDTGAWKQTALRVALFSEPTPEYPITLLQRHPDALITATRETARHPISENPDWELLRWAATPASIPAKAHGGLQPGDTCALPVSASIAAWWVWAELAGGSCSTCKAITRWAAMRAGPRGCSTAGTTANSTSSRTTSRS
jgi:hypothetical protein